MLLIFNSSTVCRNDAVYSLNSSGNEIILRLYSKLLRNSSALSV